MSLVTRFAPSPTGRLHLGHAASALLAHDRARAVGGRFLLRIEDIDPGRTREAFVSGIEEDLAWLGLRWDEPPRRQSRHMADYAAALERLKTRRLVYPCFCTRTDIARAAHAPHGDEGPLYPGTCRRLSLAHVRERMAAGAPHAWRLHSDRATARAGTLSWVDEIAGEQRARPELLGDVVLARKDAPASYHLCVTVDDALQGITHVIRGADLFAATHIHRLLQALLDLPVPSWRHHALITGPDGKRLAKRDKAKTLAELRQQGISPADIRALLSEGN